MARSNFLVFFIVAILVSMSCQGYGRRVKVFRHPQEKLLLEEMTVMDYKEPGANTNPRSGPLPTLPPPSPSAPSLH